MNSNMLWSPVTRIIHWAIALPVFFNFFIDGGDLIHVVLGYTALFFVCIRIIWGLTTQDKAHFKYFRFNLLEIKNYLSNLSSSSTKKYPSHNPLASFVYIWIWTCIALLGVTGFMMGLDAFWGEEWLETVHEIISNLLFALVLLHLSGLVFDGLKNKRKTWLGMVTGKRE